MLMWFLEGKEVKLLRTSGGGPNLSVENLVIKVEFNEKILFQLMIHTYRTFKVKT